MNRLRFRSMNVILVKVKKPKGVAIYAGDMVALLHGECFPLSAVGDRFGSIAKFFLGIAHQASGVNESEMISVDVSPTSVYEFDVGSSCNSFSFGDLLEPCLRENQKLDHCIDSKGAGSIARIMGDGDNSEEATMRVSFASAFHTGSANKFAQIG